MEAPPQEASPAALQLLCLVALNKIPDPEPAVEELLAEPQRQAPQPLLPRRLQARLLGQMRSLAEEAQAQAARVATAKDQLKASQHRLRQLEKTLAAWKQENLGVQQDLEALSQEREGWRQRVGALQELKAKWQGLQARLQRVLKDRGTQLLTLAHMLLSTLGLPGVLDDESNQLGSCEGQQDREAAGAHLPGSLTQEDVDLILWAANCLTRSAGGKKELCPKMAEEELRRLARQRQSLREELASVQRENTQLSSEAEKLRLTLQALPQFHWGFVRQLRQLLSTSGQKPGRRTPMHTRARNLQADHISLYRDMAGDKERELERTTLSYSNISASLQQEAERRGMAALCTQAMAQQLRNMNTQLRQALANVQEALQRKERAAAAAAACPTALGGLQTPMGPPGHQSPQEGRRSPKRILKVRFNLPVGQT